MRWLVRRADQDKGTARAGKTIRLRRVTTGAQTSQRLRQISASVLGGSARQRNGIKRAGTQVMLVDLNRAARSTLLLRQRVEDMAHLHIRRLIIFAAELVPHQSHRTRAFSQRQALLIFHAINRHLNTLPIQLHAQLLRKAAAGSEFASRGILCGWRFISSRRITNRSFCLRSQRNARQIAPGSLNDAQAMREIDVGKGMLQRTMLPPAIDKDITRIIQGQCRERWSIICLGLLRLLGRYAGSGKRLMEGTHGALHGFMELTIALLHRLKTIDIQVLVAAWAT